MTQRTTNGFDPIDFLERAVAIPSHDDVSGMRELLLSELSTHGHDGTVDEAGNVLATRGEGAPHLVFNTHIDTVPPHVAFSRDDEVVRGRGACDAKGPLAALLAAFLRASPPGRLTLAVTPDEETDSTGAAALDLDADGYVVGEPTGLDVCPAARGRFLATIVLTGANAHASAPAEGANAVRAAGPVLTALAGFDEAHGPAPHDLLGEPTLTPTVIRGGDATNQVPDRCEIVVDRRTVPPETATGFRSALEDYLDGHVPAGVGVAVSLADREAPFLEAFATDPEAGLVRALSAETDGRLRPFDAATEASYFAADAPTVVFGPGDLVDGDGPVAHAGREYVRVADVRAAAGIVERAVERLA